MSLGISGFQATSAPSPEYIRQKKTQRIHCHVVSKVPRSLAGLSSLNLSECSYVCFIYNIRTGIWLYLEEGIGRNAPTLASSHNLLTLLMHPQFPNILK